VDYLSVNLFILGTSAVGNNQFEPQGDSSLISTYFGSAGIGGNSSASALDDRLLHFPIGASHRNRA
jgi:hypothetical protein